jgi:hypothetical protein
MAYTTAQLILDKIGVLEADVGATNLSNIIIDAQAEVDRILKTTCEPKQEIKTFVGNGKDTYYLTNVPVMTIKAVFIDSESLDMEDVRFNREGAVTLLRSGTQTAFYSALEPNCSIRYYYAWLEDTTQYTTSGNVLAGTDITVTLDTKVGLTAGNWLRIIGTDGHEEWTKIKTVHSTNPTITCDLVYSHSSGSIAYLGAVPRIVQKLAAVVGAIMGAVYMVGSTYDFATGYTIPDFSIQKGEPYPAFLRVIDDLIKERDFLIGQIVPFPTFC